MLSENDPIRLLREVNPRVLALTRAGNFYGAVELGHATLREIGHVTCPEAWELQRLIAVSFYHVHKMKIREAGIAQTDDVIFNAEEGKMAISLLERVKAEEDSAGLMNSATCFWLAMLHMDRREYPKVRTLLRLVEKQPVYHPDYHSMLGRLAAMDGNESERKRHLKAAHQMDSTHWWVHVELGRMLNED